jgi:hypothetical protein
MTGAYIRHEKPPALVGLSSAPQSAKQSQSLELHRSEIGNDLAKTLANVRPHNSRALKPVESSPAKPGVTEALKKRALEALDRPIDRR